MVLEEVLQLLRVYRYQTYLRRLKWSLRSFQDAYRSPTVLLKSADDAEIVLGDVQGVLEVLEVTEEV